MKNTAQIWHLVISVVVLMMGGIGVWVSVNREIAGVTKDIQYQQRQIDEIKQGNNELKTSVKSIEGNVGDMKGDIKVILSKIK